MSGGDLVSVGAYVDVRRVPLNSIHAFSETGMPLELFLFCLCWQDQCYFCSGRDYSIFGLDFVWEMEFQR